MRPEGMVRVCNRVGIVLDRADVVILFQSARRGFLCRPVVLALNNATVIDTLFLFPLGRVAVSHHERVAKVRTVFLTTIISWLLVF